MALPSISPVEELEHAEQASVGLTAERFGCGAETADERRACALYLWLLGPTKQQRDVDCPCRAPAPERATHIRNARC